MVFRPTAAKQEESFESREVLEGWGVLIVLSAGMQCPLRVRLQSGDTPK